jgi:hypothetical protein
VNNAKPTCEASFEAHIDWVNDITLVQELLISCSSDKTVKAWRATAKGDTHGQITTSPLRANTTPRSDAKGNAGRIG